MAGPNLEVVISANPEALQAGVEKAKKALTEFAKKGAATEAVVEGLDAKLKQASQSFTLLSNAPFSFGVNAQKAGQQAVSGIESAVTQAAKAVTGFKLLDSAPFSFGVNAQKAAIVASNGLGSATASVVSAAKTFTLITNPRFSFGDNIRQQASRIPPSLAGIPPAFDKMTRSMGQGQSAAISFNRVIQDAPFGIMGVSNNITQLAEQFVYLKQSTGSSSAAFKTALGALFSPMNLVVLGISAITSALTFYSMRSRSAGAETKAFADTLTGLAKSSLQGEQAAQQQIVSLELLYAVTQDNTRSLRDRNKAVDELQRTYPAYFGNLSNESILTGNATAQYNKLRDAILQVANARAAEELLVENRKRELAIARELADQAQKNAKAVSESAQINRQAQQNLAGGSAGAGLQQAMLNREINKGVELVSTLGDEYAKLQKQNNELVADVQKLPYGLEASLEPADKLNEKFKRMSDQIYKLRAISMTGKIQMPELAPPAPMQLDLQIGQINMTGVMTEMELAAEAAANLFNQTFGRIVIGEDTEKEIADKVQAVRETLSDMLGGIAGEIGAAIGSGGNLIEAFGKGVIDAFGKFLTNFGKKLVDYGLAAGAFAKLQMAMLNPFTALPAAGLAVAAGLALMVAGAAASSAASGIGSGNVAGQGSQSQNVTSGTVVRPAYAEASNQPQTLIRGRDLVTLVEMNTKYKGR